MAFIKPEYDDDSNMEIKEEPFDSNVDEEKYETNDQNLCEDNSTNGDADYEDVPSTSRANDKRSTKRSAQEETPSSGKRPTHLNKINSVQKSILAEYMREHPKLAKNLLPTTAQGKAAANRMWETLTRKLNAAGPPKKEPRFWKKSFADQKFQTKKKLFLNKVSNKEKIITEEEQLIIEATGMEAAVDNLVCVGVTKFGNPKMKAFAQDVSDKCFVEEALNCAFEDDLAEGDSDGDHNTENESSTSVSAINSKNNNNASIDPMLQLLEHYLSEQKNHNKNMETKMDRIIQIQERFLALKEEQHQVSLALQRVELEIKTNQLNATKNKI